MQLVARRTACDSVPLDFHVKELWAGDPGFEQPFMERRSRDCHVACVAEKERDMSKINGTWQPFNLVIKLFIDIILFFCTIYSKMYIRWIDIRCCFLCHLLNCFNIVSFSRKNYVIVIYVFCVKSYGSRRLRQVNQRDQEIERVAADKMK